MVGALFLLLLPLLASGAKPGQIDTTAPLFSRCEKLLGQFFKRLFWGGQEIDFDHLFLALGFGSFGASSPFSVNCTQISEKYI